MKYFGGRLEKEPEIRGALNRLRGLLVSKPTGAQLQCQPQIAFKVQHFVQCSGRRIIATIDGMNLGWSADNMITAVTMARSLIETVAIVHAVAQDVKVAEERGDFINVDRALTSTMLASRHPTFSKAAAFEPKRVMKTVARFDREFLSSPVPVVKDSYELLCEFVHPNGPGLMMLHSNGRYATNDISYALTSEGREMVYQLLTFPLGLVVVGVSLLEDLLARLPELVRLAESDQSC